MTDAGALRTDHVSKWFGQQQALVDVTVSLRPGEVHALVGHNGAGKSTLLRAFAGVVAPDEGTVELDGAPVTLTPRSALEHGIVTVYQELRVIGALTVTENVFLGRELRTRGQLAKAEMRRRTAALLEEFAIAATPETRTATLPIAQRQMLEVAAGLDRGARYLLLDEPTTALEAEQIESLLAVVRRVAGTGVAVAIVDHKLDEVFAVADRITALSDGSVVLSEAVGDLHREDVVTAIVGEEATHDAAVAPVAARPGATPGATPDAEPVVAPPVSGTAVLVAEDVGTDAVGPVSLQVPAGQVTVLYGLIGSGRTEFLRALLGVDRLRRGHLEFLGRRHAPGSPADAIAAGIAYVSEDRKGEGLVPAMDSRANVSLTVLDRFRRLGLLRQGALRERSGAMLRTVGLRGDPKVSIQSLSGGNQQKVLIGRALFSEPKLLVLDEPTKGVDIGAKAEIHQMAIKLARERNIGVLVVSSEEDEVLTLADRIIVFSNGGTDGRAYRPDTLTTQALRRLALDHDTDTDTDTDAATALPAAG